MRHKLRNKNLIVHISHTDIRFDSRILKELECLKKLKNKTIRAFGIKDKINNNKNYHAANLKIETIRIETKSLIFFPKVILYFLNFIESNIIFTIRILFLRPEIIHCHDTFLLPSAIVNNTIFGSIIIYDAHELESNKNGQSYLLSKITLLIEKLSWPSISLLISVSESIIYWYEYHLGRKKNLVILNSPDISRFKKSFANKNNYLREKYEISKNSKIFIYAGLLSEGRNIKKFLQIFSEKDINDHLIIVGEGKLSTLVNKFSEENFNIHFHKSVPHYELVSLLKESDFGLCLIENISLSDYYCLPNKLFEYMFAGLHIIASDLPEINLLAHEFDCISICKDDKASLKSEINRLRNQNINKLNNPYQKLSWEHQAEKLYAAYENLID